MIELANPNRDDTVQNNKSFQLSTWKRLLPFLKPYRWLMLLLILTNIISSGMRWTTLLSSGRWQAFKRLSQGML